MQKRLILILCLIIVIFGGCINKPSKTTPKIPPPDCNDVKTRQQVMKEIVYQEIVQLAISGAKKRDKNFNEEDYKKILIKDYLRVTYENNRAIGDVKFDKDAMSLEFVFMIDNISTKTFNKVDGKYECNANLSAKGFVQEAVPPTLILYTSEFAEGNEHYVSVTLLDQKHP
jgi:hypothetical protein